MNELPPIFVITGQLSAGKSTLADAALEEVMEEIDSDLARQPDRPGWHRLDNGDEPVEATVETILSFVR